MTLVRWIRLAGWVVGGIAAVLIIAAATLWFGGGAVAKWAVEHPLSAALGRDIRIDGPLLVDWGNPTRIVAQDVQVANAAWGTRPQMFTAKRLEVVLFVRSLLFGPARVPLVRLDGADLLLETSAQGQGNWRFTTAAPKRRRQFPNLERFIVRDSKLTWHNGRTNAVTRIGIDRLDYAAPGPEMPVYVTGSGSLGGTFKTLPVHLMAEFGPLKELRNPTKPYPVSFHGNAGPVDLAITGTIGKPLDFSGVSLRLSLSGARLDELAAVLGAPLPALPPFRGTSVFTGGDGHYTLGALTMKLGTSDLEGGLTIDTDRKVPYVRAKLTSSRIDLADFKGAVGATPPGQAAPKTPAAAADKLFSNTPINVHKLPGLDADLTFYGTRIASSSGLPFDAVALDLVLENGAITVKPLRFRTANGDFELDLHFTPFTKTSPPLLDATANIRHIDLHKLLANSSSPIVRETGGIVGGFAKFDTTGTSMHEFMARMNGDAGIFMQNGQLSDLLQTIIPANVLSAIAIYATGDHPVPINCLVTRFAIKNGVAAPSTLLFDTADTIVTGTGRIDFGNETINLRLVPYNKGFHPLSLRSPIDIGGTFTHRTYKIETTGLIARLGAAIGLGVLFPPAALLPLIDTGLGQTNACEHAFAARSTSPPSEGSSVPPR